MTDLRPLTVQAAEALRGPDPLLVRDRAGTYWRLAPDGAWSAWRNGGWQPGDAPTTLLEGPAELPIAPLPGAPPPPPAQAAAPAPIGPAEYRDLVDALHARYERGEVTSGQLEASLGRFHLVHEEGTAWTVGFRSRAWFRFEAGRWVETAEEPEARRLLSVADLLGACPACGASTAGRRFCGECGAEQGPGRLTPAAAAALADFLERGYGTLPEPVTAPWDPPRGPAVEKAPARAPTTMAAPAPPAPAAVDPPAPPPRPPVTAPASNPAPPARRGSTRARLRRLWSLLSLTVGLGLLLFSLGRAVVAFTRPAASPPAVSPSPAASLAVVPSPGTSVSPAASATAIASQVPGPTIAPTPAAAPTPTVAPTPTAAPTPTGELVFADQFETAGAWPTGSTEWTAAAYVDGRYEVTVKPVDLPVAIWPVAETSVGRAATVEASLVFTDGPATTEAGLIVEDADQATHLVFVVSPDGRWSLFQDDMETFRTLLQGKSARLGAGSPIDLRLQLLDGMVGVSIDGEGVGAADQPFDLARFGLALRATEAPGRVSFDDFVVSRPTP